MSLWEIRAQASAVNASKSILSIGFTSVERIREAELTDFNNSKFFVILIARRQPTDD